jgi:GAF domain-containing protein
VYVAPSSNPRADIAVLRRRADQERQRAVRASGLAAKYEGRPPLDGLQPFYDRMAELQRRLAATHLAAAGMHDAHRLRLERWLGEPETIMRPTFLSTVATMLGVPFAAAALCGVEQVPLAVAASDTTARAAQELERVLHEGPALVAVAEGTPVMAAGSEMFDRWPRYGPAVAELDVRAVIAVPLRSSATCFGALCAYDRTPAIGADIAADAEVMAEAMAQLVLDSGGLGPPADDGFQPVIHQAAGMMAAYHDCSIGDAETLLRAHAFAENRPVADVASDVIEYRTLLA